MSKSNLLLHITNSIWLIEPSAVNQFAPVIKGLLERNPNAFDTEVKSPAIQFISADGAVQFNSDTNSITPGSVAIVSISGAIMKYDNCGDAGTQSIGSAVKQLDSNPSISAIIFKMDSPGGEVSGTENLANIIKAVSKPTIAFIDGMAASACYWLASQCNEIYCANQTDMAGSIGTMCSFADVQPALEKQGVVFHEVYADASIDKNQDFIQARQGNYDQLKEKLNSLNAVFLSSVIAGRGENLVQSETLTGKMFLAADAIKNGLIDGMKSFDEAIARAMELAFKSESNKININQLDNSTMKIKSTWVAMIAALTPSFLGIKSEDTITEEHLEKMNADLATLAEVTVAKEAAEQSLATANETITAKENAYTYLKAEFDAFKVANPGTATTVKTTTDTVVSTEENKFETSADIEKKRLKAEYGA